jgi:GntR family transcriptional regulator
MHIHASSGVPIYLQLKNQLRRAVVGGVLRPGDRLPAVRDLAAETVVNPNTVARVYRELELEGLLQTQRGVGTFVAPGAGAGGRPAERERLLDAAAQRFMAETAQLGLTPSEAVGFLTKRVATEGGKPPEREGGSGGRAVSDQDQEPE